MIGWIAILCGMGLTILITTWLVYPYKVLEWKVPTRKVITKTVKQGGVLIFESNYCKYYNIKPTITRIFENGILYYTPSTEGFKDKGCDKVLIYTPVPQELPLGEYVLTSVYKYKVNPLREMVYVRSTEKFNVVK